MKISTTTELETRNYEDYKKEKEKDVANYISTEIGPGFLANGYASPLMIPENPNLRTIPQVVKANILVLDHPGEITSSVMYPYIRMACFIIVVNQISHSTSTTTAFSRHVGLVNVLALQSL